MATRLKVVAPLATELDEPNTSQVPEFLPAPTRKRIAGWTALRQRAFIDHLALTGCVGEAAAAAGTTSPSAYRLRNRAGAESFARAWDCALQLAATRLAAIAFDRALHGRSERVYKDGELVAERKIPSDHLLTWLLARLDPLQFGSPTARALASAAGDPRETARQSLPDLTAALTDLEEADCPHDEADQFDERLGEMS
ncbi:MAG: hypothetical protein ABIR63_07315 [Sphingomicrobium sp.]